MEQQEEQEEEVNVIPIANMLMIQLTNIVFF